jgi:hypothetical protein
VKLVVWDKLVTGNLSTWEKIAEDCAIVVATMLSAKHDGKSVSACIILFLIKNEIINLPNTLLFYLQ